MLGIAKASELVGRMLVWASNWLWGSGYVGFERFEAAGFWIREREGLVKGTLGKEKAAGNWNNK